jgi:hypothetical protein
MKRHLSAACLCAVLAVPSLGADRVYKLDLRVVVDGAASGRHALEVAEGQQKSLDISPEVQLRYKGELGNAGTTLTLYKKVGNGWESTVSGTQVHSTKVPRLAYAYVCTNPPSFGLSGPPVPNIKFACAQR